MTAIYIVDYLRSPFTPAYRGALANVRPDDLVAGVIRGFWSAALVSTRPKSRT